VRVCACVYYVCMCVYVGDREREKKTEGVRTCVC